VKHESFDYSCAWDIAGEFPVIVCHPWLFERQLISGISLAETTDHEVLLQTL
jgi:hypothetical protein